MPVEKLEPSVITNTKTITKVVARAIQGPPGPAGPAGPKGDPGDSSDLSGYYTANEVDDLLNSLTNDLQDGAISANGIYYNSSWAQNSNVSLALHILKQEVDSKLNVTNGKILLSNIPTTNAIPGQVLSYDGTNVVWSNVADADAYSPLNKVPFNESVTYVTIDGMGANHDSTYTSTTIFWKFTPNETINIYGVQDVIDSTQYGGIGVNGTVRVEVRPATSGHTSEILAMSQPVPCNGTTFQAVFSSPITLTAGQSYYIGYKMVTPNSNNEVLFFRSTVQPTYAGFTVDAMTYVADGNNEISGGTGLYSPISLLAGTDVIPKGFSGKLELIDIEQGGATSNQVLKWDGTKWSPSNGNFIIKPSNPSNNDLLIYNSSSATWNSGNVPLSKVATTGASNGQIIGLVSGIWTPVNLADVSAAYTPSNPVPLGSSGFADYMDAFNTLTTNSPQANLKGIGHAFIPPQNVILNNIKVRLVSGTTSGVQHRFIFGKLKSNPNNTSNPDNSDNFTEVLSDTTVTSDGSTTLTVPLSLQLTANQRYGFIVSRVDLADITNSVVVYNDIYNTLDYPNKPTWLESTTHSTDGINISRSYKYDLAAKFGYDFSNISKGITGQLALSDIAQSAATSGQVLTWSTSSNSWVPADPYVEAGTFSYNKKVPLTDSLNSYSPILTEGNGLGTNGSANYRFTLSSNTTINRFGFPSATQLTGSATLQLKNITDNQTLYTESVTSSSLENSVYWIQTVPFTQNLVTGKTYEITINYNSSSSMNPIKATLYTSIAGIFNRIDSSFSNSGGGGGFPGWRIQTGTFKGVSGKLGLNDLDTTGASEGSSIVYTNGSWTPVNTTSTGDIRYYSKGNPVPLRSSSTIASVSSSVSYPNFTTGLDRNSASLPNFIYFRFAATSDLTFNRLDIRFNNSTNTVESVPIEIATYGTDIDNNVAVKYIGSIQIGASNITGVSLTDSITITSGTNFYIKIPMTSQSSTNLSFSLQNGGINTSYGNVNYLGMVNENKASPGAIGTSNNNYHPVIRFGTETGTVKGIIGKLDLTDLDTTDATEGMLMQFTGGKWTPVAVNPISKPTSPTNGQLLQFNGTDWVAVNNNSIPLPANPVSGQVLQFNGMSWVPYTLPSIGTPSRGTITYNQASGLAVSNTNTQSINLVTAGVGPYNRLYGVKVDVSGFTSEAQQVKIELFGADNFTQLQYQGTFDMGNFSGAKGTTDDAQAWMYRDFQSSNTLNLKITNTGTATLPALVITIVVEPF